MPMITCEVCGKHTHHIAGHLTTGACTAKEMSVKDYMKRFPDKPIMSDSWKEKMAGKTNIIKVN